MTRDDEVRAMEIATKLVLGPLSGVDLIAINAAGHAIVPSSMKPRLRQQSGRSASCLRW